MKIHYCEPESVNNFNYTMTSYFHKYVDELPLSFLNLLPSEATGIPKLVSYFHGHLHRTDD